MLKQAISDVFDRKFTLLSARPAMGRMAFTSEVISKGLSDGKKILIVTLENDETYFLIHLISRLSGLEVSDVSKYYYPCSGNSKIDNRKVDTFRLIEAVEYLQKSKLFINSNLFLDKDIVDYIVEFSDEDKFDLIVINNLDLLIKKSKYLVSEIMDNLQSLSSVLIWNCVSRDVERGNGRIPSICDINNYSEVGKYIDNNIVLYREVSNGCDIIKIVDYKNNRNLYIDYEMDFDRLKV